MPKWNFINGLDHSFIENVDIRWVYALDVALKSRATPYQSGYHVNTGAVTKDGHIVSGSNHEMAITDTVTHGEEAVIVAALEKSGGDDPIQVIAFVGLDAGLPSSCGNCRDAIKQYTNIENLIMICGPRDGGEAIVLPGALLFKDEFTEMKSKEKKEILNSEAVTQALRAEQIAYNVYSTALSPPIYGATIECENGLVFRGSFRGDVAYHPVLPISAAITNFRDGSDDLERRFVKRIVVVARGKVPSVQYKDRQHALEFAEAINSLNGRLGEPLPVYLVNIGDTSKKCQVFRTDTNDWLPYAFSPQHLGLESEIVNGIRKLFAD